MSSEIIDNYPQKEDEHERKKRMQKLVRFLRKAMNYEENELKEILSWIYADECERETVRDAVERNILYTEDADKFMTLSKASGYWTMNKSSVRVDGKIVTGKGWYKNKKDIDAFFDFLGFSKEEKSQLFYNEKNELELIILQLSTEELKSSSNIYANYQKLCSYKNEVNKIKRSGECSYSFISDLIKYLDKIAKKDIYNKRWADKTIRSRILDFYYKYTVEDKINELLVKSAFIVDHEMEKATADGEKHYKNGMKMILFLLEVQSKKPDAIKIFQKNFFASQDYFMAHMLDFWNEKWDKCIDKNGPNLKKLQESIFQLEDGVR